jgi:3-methyladenine DNA glycosylase Mpg
MTRTLSTALLALVLGFGTPAIAQDNPQLTTLAQNTLEQYGYEVDADMLSLEQLAEFQAYFGSENELTSPASAQQRIDEILSMEAGTYTYVSEDMRALFEDTTMMEQTAQDVLQQAGPSYAEVDVSGLTNEQLARIYFLKERDVVNDPAELENALQAILDES